MLGAAPFFSREAAGADRAPRVRADEVAVRAGVFASRAISNGTVLSDWLQYRDSSGQYGLEPLRW